ncbi:serine peptidase [Streptomyces spectabilis]|uniref:Serine peptidase n=1 Tax=Streptomyces spectabilis TaxID=68270 RepID=A0A516R322_STRST|nr:serine peptidase [Streptomyces spectabilis]QDQ10059.1 serine peptidase [Streptomyces spectabilis]
MGNHQPGQSAQDASARLTEIWQRHLARGPAAALARTADLSVAYYAHHVQDEGAQGDDVGLDDLPDDAERLVRLWLDELGLPDEEDQGPGTWPVRQALGWLAARRRLSPQLVERFVARFFGEVATYLRSGSRARDDARNAVAEAIARERPEVVIAHSLGSVVAYEALWAHPERQVELFLTLGSPLALPHAVFPRLDPAPADGVGERPPSVRRWVNVADLGDLVALPVRGVSRHFRGVDADTHETIHAFDFHLAAHYLASAAVGETLTGHADARRARR